MYSGEVYVSKDVKFDEQACWNWEKKQVKIKKIEEGSVAFESTSGPTNYIQYEQSDHDVDSDPTADTPTKKTKSFAEIYERCNLAVIEPSNFDETSKYPK